MKICNKCKIEKEEDQFYSVYDSRYPTRLRGECKECTIKSHYKSNKEYQKSDKSKEYQKKYQKEYRNIKKLDKLLTSN